ncbi:hypothetical protein [Nostoc sp. FACHB-280]|nr:hypothetical protein [Nostoc sp. FACHB-280]
MEFFERVAIHQINSLVLQVAIAIPALNQKLKIVPFHRNHL